MNRPSLGLVLAAALAAPAPARAGVDDGTYANPVLFGDYSDPDAVRAGDDYYMVASSFQAVPGLPILRSRDLVHWTLVGHAAPRLPSPDFDGAQHGGGLWAPSLRHHAGYFWIYVADPDRGVYVTRARDPRGPWEPLDLVLEARGVIDPCPLWDEDESVYLVHAWAKSRAGFNGVLTLRRLSADGRRVVGEPTTVFEGGRAHPTIEGPKLYKRNGWYYIFAPAGGVKTGWQTVLRSRSVTGPYEDRIVLDQGGTDVNGPHQGAWVETPEGESWFLHFQDRGAYGRVVHLQPMAWHDGWPVIGDDPDGNGRGEPVRRWRRPRVGPAAPGAPQASDEFDGARPGLQWQWHGNPGRGWASVGRGALRLAAVPAPEGAANLWGVTSLLLQKLPAPAFVATARLDARGLRRGERAGLVVMGRDYSTLAVRRTAAGFELVRSVVKAADAGTAETDSAVVSVPAGVAELRVTVATEAVCRFAFSRDGRRFEPIGEPFVARPGLWIGAKVGLFALGPPGARAGGRAEFDWFRVEPISPERDERADLVVAQDRSGDFATVQAALDAIPEDNAVPRIVLVRRGVYREKLFMTKSHVALVGEDREATRIEFAELRRSWREKHPDDWGAAVVNIGPEATDLVIGNLTIRNDYGRLHGDHDHQFAIRAGGGATRIALLHADVVADGGDTVSLWNTASGLYYHADCYFEGWVDYVCPRGWAYITNSRFFGHNTTASIWHDGSQDEDQKLVIRHSRFDGVPGFALGRNHRDAQFYLLDAEFSARMADRPVYRASPAESYRWGPRYYYWNCRREGGDSAWHADNLDTVPGSPREEEVTAAWTFRWRWDPEEDLPAVLPFAAIPRPTHGARRVDAGGVTLRWIPARNARAHRVHFGGESPPPFRAEQAGRTYETGPLEPGRTYHWRVDSVTPQGVVPGPLWSFVAGPRRVRIVLAGDSTVTDESGWGRGFRRAMGDGVGVVNAARGGRSSKSYRAEGHWARALAQRPDYVLLQFGHNDVPGKGVARETDLPTYRANLARYVEEARAAGATPVVLTPLTRRNFTPEGALRSDLADYAAAAKEAAAAARAPLVDLHARSVEAVERLGAERALALGPVKPDGTVDRTHLGEEGGALFGAIVADELAKAVPALAPHVRRAIVETASGRGR